MKICRQANAMAEIEYGFNFLLWCVFQYELYQDAKCHFFTVVAMMTFLQLRHAVMNGMSCRQAATFKSNAAKIGISFDNILYRFGANTLFNRDFCLIAIFQ